MKMKTSEASRRLDRHPSELFQLVVELFPSSTFKDVWPEIDEDWIETLSALNPEDNSHKTAITRPGIVSETHTPLVKLTKNAIHVLDKLNRQRKYGNIAVAFESLMKMAHLSKRDLEEVIIELRKEGLLDHDVTSGRGTISLDTAKKYDIEAITR